MEQQVEYVTIPPTELRLAVETLARTRAQAADLAAALEMMDQEWKNKQAEVRGGVDYVTTTMLLNAVKAEQEALEQEIRDNALVQYELNHDKHPVDGVTVKVFTDILVSYDEGEARKWAWEHSPEMLILDAKALNELAKTVFPTGRLQSVLPFAEGYERSNPKAQIDKDLSKLLPQEK